jgi:hypothetical protein
MVVETNGEALVGAILSVAGHRRVVLEEGTQAGWLSELLEPHAVEVVVAVVDGRRGQKSDELDAYELADRLRLGAVKRRVFKAEGQFRELRHLARAYRMLTADTVGTVVDGDRAQRRDRAGGRDAQAHHQVDVPVAVDVASAQRRGQGVMVERPGGARGGWAPTRQPARREVDHQDRRPSPQPSSELRIWLSVMPISRRVAASTTLVGIGSLGSVSTW